MDIKRFVADCGGATAIAKAAGVPRTAPYRWIAKNFVSSRVIDMALAHNPNLDLNQYFNGAVTNDSGNARETVAQEPNTQSGS